MKKLWIALPLILLLWGCDSQGLGMDGKTTTTLVPEDFPITRNELTSELALLSPQTSLRIGQKLNSALVGGFRKPDRAVIVRELPPGFNSDFSANGWEMPERTVSLVGVDQDLVLALDMANLLNQTKATESVTRYENMFGLADRVIEGPTAKYWFWNDGEVRLMVCRVNQSADSYRLTAVLGMRKAMETLRMDPDSAMRDVGSAAEMDKEKKSQ
jgi:hypothetical protein